MKNIEYSNYCITYMVNNLKEVVRVPSIGVQRQCTLQGKVEVNSPVLFNQSIVDDDLNIKYDEGTFKFTCKGKYYVSWFVSLKSTMGIYGPEFGIKTNEDPAVTYAASNGMKTSQVTGFALLEVKEGFSFQLINLSEGEACFTDNADVTAGIAILNVTPMEAIQQTVGGVQLTLNGYSGTNIASLIPIPFDTEVKRLSDHIKNKAGSIEINTAGHYLVDWWVAIAGSSNAESIRFSLIDNVNGTVLGESYSPVVLPNVFYGNAILEIKKVPINISLTNNSGTSLTFASTSKQAGIRIVEMVAL